MEIVLIIFLPKFEGEGGEIAPPPCTSSSDGPEGRLLPQSSQLKNKRKLSTDYLNLVSDNSETLHLFDSSQTSRRKNIDLLMTLSQRRYTG